MKIYLAAIEQNQCIEVVKDGLIPNAFYSYYYLRKSEKMCENMRNNRQYHELIFVDSGAHSFFAENHDQGLSVSNLKKKTKTKETPDEYMANYLKWIVKNYEHFDYYAELDIGEIVGQEKVLFWRDQLRELGVYDKCVPVFHPGCMSFDDYIEMLETCESGYVAMEGDRDNRDRIDYNTYLYEAHKRNIKTHGFAMTKNDVFLKYGFWSVDSSSWKAGIIFGMIQIFFKNRMMAIECKSMDEVKWMKGADLNQLHNEEKSIENLYRLKASAKGYLKMGLFLKEVWKERGIVWK
jgi:hypothetical protein